MHPQLQLHGLHEWRWDPDARRVNMHTAGGGLLWTVRPDGSLRLMIAREWNRRNLPAFSDVWFAGLFLTTAL